METKGPTNELIHDLKKESFEVKKCIRSKIDLFFCRTADRRVDFLVKNMKNNIRNGINIIKKIKKTFNN